MPIENMECPNCGAPIDFAGGTTATCSFCNSRLTLTSGGVTTASALNDLVNESTDPLASSATRSVEPGPYGLDLAPIQDQLLRGHKIEAIKLYREQTGVGLREAKEAVEAIERGELPTITADQRHQAGGLTRQRRSSSRFGCLPGCLSALVFIAVCAGFMMLSSQVMFRVWGPLDQVLRIINNHPQVTQAFGQPVSIGPFVTGKISGGGNSSSASFGAPLYGPKRSGDLSVSGSWRRGIWDVSIWVTYADEDGEEQTIHISQQIK